MRVCGQISVPAHAITAFRCSVQAQSIQAVTGQFSASSYAVQHIVLP